MKAFFVASALCLAVGAQATTYLDDFSTGPYAVTLSGLQTNSSEQFGSMLGGSRTTNFLIDANTFGQTATWYIDQAGLNGNPKPGLSTDAGVGVSITTELTYSGLTGFSSPTGFSFDFASNDQPLGLLVEVTTSTHSGFVSSNTTVGVHTSAFTYVVNTFSGGIDYSHVTGIYVEFDGQPGGDFALNDIRATAAPEPASVALLGLAVLGMGLRRLKK